MIWECLGILKKKTHFFFPALRPRRNIFSQGYDGCHICSLELVYKAYCGFRGFKLHIQNLGSKINTSDTLKCFEMGQLLETFFRPSQTLCSDLSYRILTDFHPGVFGKSTRSSPMECHEQNSWGVSSNRNSSSDTSSDT